MNFKVFQNIITIPLLVMILSTLLLGQQIYFVENQNGKINKSDIIGNTITELSSDSVGMYGIATDFINKKIYSSNVVTDEIFVSNIDGSSQEVFLNSSIDTVDGPRGIAIDNKNNRIYWAESISGKIRSSNLDGDSTWTIISDLVSPVDVALDLVNNKLFWSDNGLGAKKISKSNFDGTDTMTVIEFDSLDQIGGIEIDVDNGKLYWVDFGDTNKISMANLDGSSLVILNSDTLGSPRGLTIDRDAGKLFWTDVLDSSITKINLNGTLKSTIISLRSSPIGISANNPATLPVSAQLKIFIEGPYDSVNNNMITDIAAYIPIVSPYLVDDRIIEIIPTDIVDWILVELRETRNGPAIASKSALLHKDGRIVADDGTNSIIKISADAAPYYVVIKHRNHLPVISNSLLNLTNN